MFDFRLKVFHTVARRLSFTKAAEELFISQPAVTKHIHGLEEQLGIALFERIGNRIRLTQGGKLLLQYASQIFLLYGNMEYDLHQLKQDSGGLLNIGASSTIAQYYLPGVLARFNQEHPAIRTSLINGNTEQIEQALLHKDIEVGIIEGHSRNPQLKYTELAKDEIALICNPRFKPPGKGPLSTEDLRAIPLLVREHGSGTLEVIVNELKKLGLKLTDLNILMHMGSSEGIKSYLREAPCAAFLSLRAVQSELESGALKVLPVKQFKLIRKYHFIHPQGQQHKLAQLFMKFAKKQSD